MDETAARAGELVAGLLHAVVGNRVRRLWNEELAELLELDTTGGVRVISLPEDATSSPRDMETETYVEIENTGDSSNLRLQPLILFGGHVAVPWNLAEGNDEKYLAALHSYLSRLAAESSLTPGTEQGAVIVVNDESLAARGIEVALRVTFTVNADLPTGLSSTGAWLRVRTLDVVTRRPRATNRNPQPNSDAVRGDE